MCVALHISFGPRPSSSRSSYSSALILHPPPPLFRSCIHCNCIIPTGGTGNVEGLLSTTASWNSKENVPSNGTELVGFHEGAGSRVMIKLMWVMSSLIAVAKF